MRKDDLCFKKDGRMGGFNYLSFILHRNFQMITGSGGFVQCQIFIPIFWGDFHPRLTQIFFRWVGEKPP